ncbi:TetR/AcrR family transcriptional regulator [Dactylosporangium salmoneum]|uniref:TetR/AcrR family transcriptional regulator n=1 Tax=Dactylosporangium salmoneum TaxID=53361 RepID=A0ABP5UEW8_9ACTN
MRDRLVRAGVELVAEGGTVSLREIARRAGVSHGAPRRYFPTHVELLSAIAGEGFASLGACLAAVPPEGPPRARLSALAHAYVEFATANRGMYELMFRHDLLRSDRLGLRETSLPLFESLAALLAAARPTPDPVAAAGALWSNLHGIIQLWWWGSLPLAAGPDSLPALIDAAVAAHAGPS